MVTLVFPVLATPANINLPFDAVPGKDDTVPAFPEEPACKFPAVAVTLPKVNARLPVAIVCVPALSDKIKLLVATPGSVIEITLAWPIAALEMVVTVFPVLATATKRKLPLDAVPENEAK